MKIVGYLALAVGVAFAAVVSQLGEAAAQAVSATTLQDVLPSPPWAISANYGPRSLMASPLHGGIDYLGPQGAVVRALEAGTILDIDGSDAYIYFVTIHGSQTGEIFQYLHLFNNDVGLAQDVFPRMQLVTDNGAYLVFDSVPFHGVPEPNYYEATLDEIPDGAGGTIFVIIFWSDRASRGSGHSDVMVKALARVPQLFVAQGQCVRAAAPECYTRNTVGQGEAVATVGNSGFVGVHLHLQAHHRRENPLYYLKHPASAYGFTFRASTSAVRSGDPPVSIEATINSGLPGFPPQPAGGAAIGLDVNRVDLSITQHGQPRGGASFRYNGRPDEGHVGFSQTLQPPFGQPRVAGSSAVQPSTQTSSLQPSGGLMDFFLLWDFSAMTPGDYVLSLEAKNIRNEVRAVANLPITVIAPAQATCTNYGLVSDVTVPFQSTSLRQLQYAWLCSGPSVPQPSFVFVFFLFTTDPVVYNQYPGPPSQVVVISEMFACDTADDPSCSPPFFIAQNLGFPVMSVSPPPSSTGSFSIFSDELSVAFYPNLTAVTASVAAFGQTLTVTSPSF